MAFVGNADLTAETCLRRGCSALLLARGLCGKHYSQARAGRLGLEVPPHVRFWDKVDLSGSCWIWQGAVDRAGYGRISKRTYGVSLAHRWAYEWLCGPIPEGLHLDHLCRTTSCVKPYHLEPVTQRENNLRSEGVSALAAKVTHCPRGHEYSPENTYFSKEGYRRGRTCTLAGQKARKRKVAA